MLLGASAGTAAEAGAAERDGADYLGVGAIYEARGSKADAGAPVGLDRLAQIRAVVRIPIVGIGGIKAENAADVIRAGADGVAVITAVVASPDMRAPQRMVRPSTLRAGRSDRDRGGASVTPADGGRRIADLGGRSRPHRRISGHRNSARSRASATTPPC
jgi:hypothetical protein